MRLFMSIVMASLMVVTFQNCAGQNTEFGVAQDVIETDVPSLIEEQEDAAHTEMLTKVAATKPTCRILKTAYVAKLNQVYEYQGVRVFYSIDRSNPDAVIYLTDRNKNKFPDYVEDIARQIGNARAGLNALGFIDPLKSARYQAYRVKYIDVHIKSLEGNGLAYDEPVVYSNNALKKNACTLQIELSNKLEAFPGTWSVGAHELFHLYEYGYTMFKRSWFLEGMAAWGERVIRVGALRSNGLTPLPTNVNQLANDVFDVPYNYLWDRLAYLSEINKQGAFALSTTLKNATYVDGTRIYKDQNLLGITLMKVILKHLAQESNTVSKEKRWSTLFWEEADQKDSAHDKRIIIAVQRALKELKMDKLNLQEIATFLKLQAK